VSAPIFLYHPWGKGPISCGTRLCRVGDFQGGGRAFRENPKQGKGGNIGKKGPEKVIIGTDR
jgi:hypothetical protein